MEEYLIDIGKDVSMSDPVKEVSHPLIPSDYVIVNTDMACGSLGIALAMIIRDSERKLVFLMSNVVQKMDPNLAELKALEWVIVIALKRNLGSSLWLCDSLAIVNVITNEEEPCSWNAYYKAANV
ncbi:hypothetical protein FNV43_RR24673 [Rhamnella rubrinervis]|uniref:RNase H type-1 domain-containing protein n=1 Tax=Rhamnella rubrinervis TaxID=2594499 RepID=A0A8K0GQG1_9ROSA|nr:hypothetical protein FNV43_RR24673 [Rhamnella rubrinervis]